MLVNKGDFLTRLETLRDFKMYVTYEVIMADEEYFLLAIRCPKKDKDGVSYIHTDLENLSLYSNKEEINTLESMNFEKLIFDEKE